MRRVRVGSSTPFRPVHVLKIPCELHFLLLLLSFVSESRQVFFSGLHSWNWWSDKCQVARSGQDASGFIIDKLQNTIVTTLIIHKFIIILLFRFLFVSDDFGRVSQIICGLIHPFFYPSSLWNHVFYDTIHLISIRLRTFNYSWRGAFLVPRICYDFYFLCI